MGIVVKRLNMETPPAKSGSSLGLCVFPTHMSCIAIAEHMATKNAASSTDIAEACLSESAGDKLHKYWSFLYYSN